MSEPFIGEVRLMAFDYPPRSWAQCDGQLLPVNQNPVLYSLIGTTYGGDGNTNFALPDLRGRAIVHAGSGYSRGDAKGYERAVLTEAQIGSHSHTTYFSADDASVSKPKFKHFARGQEETFSTDLSKLQTMNTQSVSTEGSGQSHENMQPSMVLNYCIALDGLYPERD